ncbi:MAG: 4-carboxy-4-hydroxy-2-oxoadipate aldolase/oxaloacetate decarboxylase [Bacillota bacterium]
MVHVRTRIERPERTLVEQFRSLSAATVHEASGRKGAVDCLIKPVGKGGKICGPAFTVACAPGDNLMLHKALERAQPGDVIVASTGGAYDYGYWGGLMSVSAVARELGGLAIDGCIRDSDDIVKLGFPVFCRGYAIRGTTKATLGLVNYPIVFGGVSVDPGDIILGDSDGIVVVKRNECLDVLEKSLKRVSTEAEKASILGKGASSVKYNDLDKVFESLGLVEE